MQGRRYVELYCDNIGHVMGFEPRIVQRYPRHYTDYAIPNSLSVIDAVVKQTINK